MPIESREQWAHRLDRFVAVTAAGYPVALNIGNVGFEAVVGLVGLAWILRWALIGRNPFDSLKGHPLLIPALIWYGCVVVSSLVNPFTAHTLVHDIVFIRHLLFLFAILDISQRLPVARYLLTGLIVGILWAAANKLSAHVIGFDLIGKPVARYAGKLKESGRMSGLTAFAAPLLTVWAICARHWDYRRRAAIFAVGLLGFVLLMLTSGRTAIIGASVSFVFAIAFFARRRIPLKLAVGLLIVLAITIGLFFQSENARDLESTYYRVNFWKVSFMLWLDNPVLGVGVGSFQEAYARLAESDRVEPFLAPAGTGWQLGNASHAHNLVLQLLSTTGVLGLFAFGWLFINTLRLLWRLSRHENTGLVTWPVAFLVIGLAGWNIYDGFYSGLCAYFIGFIAAEDGRHQTSRAF